ncbi:hypothetical protein L3V82_04600 [Thiotrichales bacterium 19S3-7]|nr:hypothetical protein [Thiotrichales bacterium 19S3-7]MCF6801376.1 hypothetical protein [Thiotrichales bacterium 19S3-11]
MAISFSRYYKNYIKNILKDINVPITCAMKSAIVSSFSSYKTADQLKFIEPKAKGIDNPREGKHLGLSNFLFCLPLFIISSVRLFLYKCVDVFESTNNPSGNSGVFRAGLKGLIGICFAIPEFLFHFIGRTTDYAFNNPNLDSRGKEINHIKRILDSVGNESNENRKKSETKQSDTLITAYFNDREVSKKKDRKTLEKEKYDNKYKNKLSGISDEAKGALKILIGAFNEDISQKGKHHINSFKLFRILNKFNPFKRLNKYVHSKKNRDIYVKAIKHIIDNSGSDRSLQKAINIVGIKNSNRFSFSNKRKMKRIEVADQLSNILRNRNDDKILGVKAKQVTKAKKVKPNSKTSKLAKDNTNTSTSSSPSQLFYNEEFSQGRSSTDSSEFSVGMEVI